MVALAARKVYRHRLRVLRLGDEGWERSGMYGSGLADVREMLEGVWRDRDGDGRMRSRGEVADGVIEGIIGGVEVPV